MADDLFSEARRIPCPDLGEALSFFQQSLGFRLDMIAPADAPREAVVSGHGLQLRLLGEGTAPDRRDDRPARVISRASGGFSAGRAGMEYRDLLPGRAGGAVIASHIRLGPAGPVPDYVHYHHVGVQLIYCRRGRIQVVYQDQGEPFWISEGDLIVQPPTIRHRVLASQGDAEVVEVSAPAEHPTLVDHDLVLPNPPLQPGRSYGGQQFLHHRGRGSAADAVEDMAVDVATGGRARVRVIRTSPWKEVAAAELVVAYVLAGEMTLADGEVLGPDDCVVQADGGGLAWSASADAQVLVVGVDLREG